MGILPPSIRPLPRSGCSFVSSKITAGSPSGIWHRVRDSSRIQKWGEPQRLTPFHLIFEIIFEMISSCHSLEAAVAHNHQIGCVSIQGYLRISAAVYTHTVHAEYVYHCVSRLALHCDL